MMDNQYQNSPPEATPGQHVPPQCDHSHQPQQQRPPLNADEQRTYRECIKETFYYRCIPFSVIGSSIVFMGFKAGYLKECSRFGYAPKMAGAALVGFVLGKFSYQNACAEKFMRLPNSPVGDVLRKRKNQDGIQESLSPESSFKMDEKWDGFQNQNTTFKDHQNVLHNNSSLTGLTPAPSNSGPDGGSPYYSPPAPESPSHSHESTYTPSDHSVSTNSSYTTTPIPGQTIRKNKYGDDVEV